MGAAHRPNSTMISTVPSRSGDNEDKLEETERSPSPASAAASDTMMFTGDPVRNSSDPQWAANASGNSSDDAIPALLATTTTRKKVLLPVTGDADEGAGAPPSTGKSTAGAESAWCC